MKTTCCAAIAVAALCLTSAGAAWAQQGDTVVVPEGLPVRARTGAFELGVSTAYTQGFGNIAEGRQATIGSIANAGLGVGASFGFRASPYLGIAITGIYQEFIPDNRLPEGTDVRGLVTSAEFSLHGNPFAPVDPFMTIGAGYRMFWEAPQGPNNNVLFHGFQLAKVTFGIDLRATPDIAIGPYIGADVGMFFWENREGPLGDLPINDPRWNAFVQAGVQGRFNAGGTLVTKQQGAFTLGSR